MANYRIKPLLPQRLYVQRLLRNLWLALGILVGSLLMGVIGYHLTEGLPWLDSLLNASMILGGMGPVNELHTQCGKLFASFYALFSGVVFISSVAVLLAPMVLRFLHKFHLDLQEVEENSDQKK